MLETQILQDKAAYKIRQCYTLILKQMDFSNEWLFILYRGVATRGSTTHVPKHKFNAFIFTKLKIWHSVEYSVYI